MPNPEAAVLVLLYFVLPLWLAKGFADYRCHRALSIELTTGFQALQTVAVHVTPEKRAALLDTPQVYRAPYDDLQGLGRHFEDVAKHGYSYSSGICIGSNASEPAKALQAFLSAPAAASVIRKNGMDPSHP